MEEDDIIIDGSESRASGYDSGSQERSSYESYYPPYPNPYYFGHNDYPMSRFVPPPPPFTRPICEAANTVYGPASFSQPGQSGDPTSYEIEVSVN